MSDDSVEKKYERAFEQAAHLQPVFAVNARHEMAQMVEAIAKAQKNINDILSTNQSAPVKGGYLAEEFHALTFNMDAILKGDNARAYTDRYNEWFELEWNGDNLHKNDTPDLAASRDGRTVTLTGQNKTYYSAEKTAAEMSQTVDGAPKYGKVDTLIGPEDQVNPSAQNVLEESELVPTTTIQEHATARAEALRAQNGDPAQIEAHEQTAQKVRDRFQDGNVSSTPLSKDEANAMGAGDTGKFEEIAGEYQTRSTLTQMSNAAIGAAAMSAVVSGVMNTLRYIQLVNNGKISAEEATLKIMSETVVSAADSALKASANAGVQSLLVRYGSEKAAIQMLAGQGLKSMLKTNVATIGVVCAVDAVKDLVRLGIGQISSQEFFDRQGKNILMTSAGVAGSAVGGAAGLGFATALGISSGTIAMTVIGIIGSMSGGIIAGLAMDLAIEYEIDKPYRALMENTANLKQAIATLEDVSNTMFKSQILFTEFLKTDTQMEITLENQMNRIDEAGKRAFAIISQV